MTQTEEQIEVTVGNFSAQEKERLGDTARRIEDALDVVKAALDGRSPDYTPTIIAHYFRDIAVTASNAAKRYSPKKQ